MPAAEQLIPLPPETRWIAADVGADGLRAWAMPGAHPLPAGRDMKSLGGGVLPCLVNGHSGAPDMALPGKPRTVRPSVSDGRLHMVPGLVGHGIIAPVAGFLAHNSGWDGVVCLPGALSHWVMLSAEEIISIQSFLSGDLRDALAGMPSLAGLPAGNGFVAAVSETLSRPERLAAGLAAPQSQAQVAGLVIGAELAAARPYWLGQQVAVIGPPEDAAPYVSALRTQAVPVIETDAASMLLAGLEDIWRRTGQTS